MKITSAFVALIPEDKPLVRELNRGLKAPFTGKNVDGVFYIQKRFAHPRTPEEEKTVAIGYWSDRDIDGCKVLVATGKGIYGWFCRRYKTVPLTKAWKDTRTRLALKQGGIPFVDEPVGRPDLPKTVYGVSLEELKWD